MGARPRAYVAGQLLAPDSRVNGEGDWTRKRMAHLAQRMEQPGFGGTGRLQQEQGLTTPHLRANGRGCEGERQFSGVTEPWSFRRLLLGGCLGPNRACERTAGIEREGGVFTACVDGHHGQYAGAIITIISAAAGSETSPLAWRRAPTLICAGHGQRGERFVTGIIRTGKDTG